MTHDGLLHMRTANSPSDARMGRPEPVEVDSLRDVINLTSIRETNQQSPRRTASRYRANGKQVEMSGEAGAGEQTLRFARAVTLSVKEKTSAPTRR